MKTKIFLTGIMLMALNITLSQANLSSITGKYFAADGIEFENAMRMKKKQKEDLEVTFVGEANGKIENKMILKWKGGSIEAFLDEKLFDKKQLVWFKAGANHFVLLEDGVIAITNEQGSQVGDVLAKNKSKLSEFDLDTAKAVIESLKSELNSEADDAEKQKLMKSHKAYKENIGKVVFSENVRLFSNAYVQSTPEDPTKFIKTQTLGKYIAYQAYFDVKPAKKYGSTSELNIEYEFEGQKLDRKSQAKKGRAWSNLPKVEAFNEFTMKQGRLLVGDATLDYTMAQAILNVRDKLQFGKSYNLKVTIYAYKDGANVAKLAEGTIALKYEPESEKALDTWQEWIDKM